MSQDSTVKMITPGRRRKACYVKKITSDLIVRASTLKCWSKRKAHAPVAEGEDIGPVAEGEDVGPLAASDPWRAFAFWGNCPIESVRTVWEVPNSPKDCGQTIYLFCGIQVDLRESPNSPTVLPHILQPVLQWAPERGGKGRWSVASWFAGTTSHLAVHTPFTHLALDPVPGKPPTSLIGSIRRTVSGCGNGGLDTYVCEFEGYPKSKLTVEMPTGLHVVETLEVYDVVEGNKDAYPSGFTRAIEIEINAPKIVWEVVNREKTYPRIERMPDDSHNGGGFKILWNDPDEFAETRSA